MRLVAHNEVAGDVYSETNASLRLSVRVTNGEFISNSSYLDRMDGDYTRCNRVSPRPSFPLWRACWIAALHVRGLFSIVNLIIHHSARV